MSQAVLERLKAQMPTLIFGTSSYRGDETATVDRKTIYKVCSFLRDADELKFDMLTDLTAVDYLGRNPRFEVVYQLYSVPLKHRVRVKVQVPEEDPTVDTVSGLWAVADWLEREVWDLYGIRFNGHPDPRRILLYEEFVGHPLRKDYPKQHRQPRVRRPQDEIDRALAKRQGERRNIAAP